MRYDICIIGAGASGLFATGAALSFGKKTLLVDQGNGFVGGDCSNAACVPSKALRSIARRQTSLESAQNHIFNTVTAVRTREDAARFHNVTNLEFIMVESSQFISKNEMLLIPQNATQPPQQIRAEQFLIATGASPIVPPKLQKDATLAGLPLLTYRDILTPNKEKRNRGAKQREKKRQKTDE